MAKRLDYKFRSIRREGGVTVAEVAFYLGEDGEERNELTGEMMPVYRRSQLLALHTFRLAGHLNEEAIRQTCDRRVAELLRGHADREALPSQTIR